MDWASVKNGLIELAFIDESYPYEVDQAMIGIDKTTSQFVLMTATGCSCWEGESTVEEFSSLEELESSLMNKDRTYNPSLKGAESLLQEAKLAYAKYMYKTFGQD